MNRRDAMKTLGVAAALSAPAAAALAQAKPAAGVTIPGQLDHPGVEGKLTVNRPQAYAVMEALGVDGLVATSEINVRYLANSLPTLTKMRADSPAFATFPRDPGRTPFFITSTGSAMETANGEREVPEIMPFSWPGTWNTTFTRT